jgi:hypothetical protein
MFKPWLFGTHSGTEQVLDLDLTQTIALEEWVQKDREASHPSMIVTG